MRIRFAEQHFDAAPIGPVDHEHTTDRRARCSGSIGGLAMMATPTSSGVDGSQESSATLAEGPQMSTART